jgi:hypothetical protein
MGRTQGPRIVVSGKIPALPKVKQAAAPGARQARIRGSLRMAVRVKPA